MFVCLYYIFGCTYVICTLTLSYFCVSWVFDPVPNFTKQNPLVFFIITHIILEIELFTALNYFADAVKTKKTYGSSISTRVSCGGKLIRYLSVISPTQQYLLENSLSTRRTTKVGLV